MKFLEDFEHFSADGSPLTIRAPNVCKQVNIAKEQFKAFLQATRSIMVYFFPFAAIRDPRRTTQGKQKPAPDQQGKDGPGLPLDKAAEMVPLRGNTAPQAPSWSPS